MRKNEVRVDARGHISLGFRKHKEHRLYLVSEDPDGTIHLIPATVVPARPKIPMSMGSVPEGKPEGDWADWGSEAPWRT